MGWAPPPLARGSHFRMRRRLGFWAALRVVMRGSGWVDWAARVDRAHWAAWTGRAGWGSVAWCYLPCHGPMVLPPAQEFVVSLRSEAPATAPTVRSALKTLQWWYSRFSWQMRASQRQQPMVDFISSVSRWWPSLSPNFLARLGGPKLLVTKLSARARAPPPRRHWLRGSDSGDAGLVRSRLTCPHHLPRCHPDPTPRTPALAVPTHRPVLLRRSAT